MEYPYKMSDEELIDYFCGNCGSMSVDERRIIIDEILVRPELYFDSGTMSLDTRNVLLGHLSKSVTRGVYLTPPHGEMLANMEKTAIIKSRAYPLTQLFNVLVSGDKAYGFIRFAPPVTVPSVDIEKYEGSHRVSKSDVERWWPNKENLLVYSVRDFIPFFETRLVKSSQAGSQVFIDPVEYIEVPEDFVIKSSTFEFSFRDDQNRIVYGPVLIPNTPDTQGDIISPEEIMKAEHRFMLKSQTLGVEHFYINDGIRPVESYIAPTDMVLGGRQVLRGTWIMGSKVFDEAVWEDILSGKLTGYSMEGYGKRVKEPV